MNVGLQIDFVGWFALVLILAALYILNTATSQNSDISVRQKRSIGLLLAALLIMLTSVCWTSDGSNVVLTVVMVLLGVVIAPISSRYRIKSTALSSANEDTAKQVIKGSETRMGLLGGIALISIGAGLSVALLGLAGWFDTDPDLFTWDIRLISLISVFIGVWTFAAGLMLWLRLNKHLPPSQPSALQKRLGLMIFTLAMVLIALAVFYPASASILMIVLSLLALEMGALSALGVVETRVARVLGQHIGLIGAAITLFGYVQASLFLLSLGGLIIAAAIHYLRGAMTFQQARRRRSDF